MSDSADYKALYRKFGHNFASKFLQVPVNAPTDIGAIDADFMNIERAIEIARTYEDVDLDHKLPHAIRSLRHYFVARTAYAAGLAHATVGAGAARRTGDKRALGHMYQVEAIMRASQGDIDSAADLFRKSAELADDVSDLDLKLGATTNLGVIAYLQSDTQLAIAYTKESLSVARQIGDATREVLLLSNLGLLLHERADYAQARTYLEDAAARGEILDEWHLESSVYINLGIVLGKQGAVDEARRYLSLRIDSARMDQHVEDFMLSVTILAEIELREDNVAAAHELLKQVEPFLDNVQLANTTGFTLCQLGSCAARIGETTQAEAYWARGLSLANEQGNKRLEYAILLEQAEHLLRIHEIEAARKRFATVLANAPRHDMCELEGRAAVGMARLALADANNADGEQFLSRARAIFDQPSWFAVEIDRCAAQLS